VLEEVGAGCVVFSPLAQGLLTDKYLGGVPEGSRGSRPGSLPRELLEPETLERVRGLNDIARERGQTLAQLALAWVLRDPRVTTALIGASSVRQLEDNVAAVTAPPLTDSELAQIDRLAVDDTQVDLWRAGSMVGSES
jgi:L-glyceraldehyde 3-phosphate reductase